MALPFQKLRDTLGKPFSSGGAIGKPFSSGGAIGKPFRREDTFKEGFDKRERQSRAGGALAGAAQGASTAMGLSGGNPLAAAGGAIVGGITGVAGAGRTAVERFEDDRLANLMQRSEDMELGDSDAETRKATGEMQDAARAGIQAQQAELARTQLGAGAGYSGNFAELQRQLAGQEAAAGVEAAGQAEDLSQQRARQERKELDSRMRDRSARDADAEATRSGREAALNEAVKELLADPDIREQLLQAGLADLSATEQEGATQSIMSNYGLEGDYDLGAGLSGLGGATPTNPWTTF